MIKKVRIGNMEIGGIPRIVATLHKETEIKRLESPPMHKAIDIVEVRADKLYKGSRDKLETIIRKIRQNNFPVILTAREGEGYRFSHSERLAVFSEFISLVDAVDIELTSVDSAKVVAKVKEQGKTVIISHHDFKKTPSASFLKGIMERAAGKGADIVKVAVQPLTPLDAAALMCLCMDISGKYPAVFISMGKVGEFTRIYAPFFGSCLTYGYISEPAAPGQMKVVEIDKQLSCFYRELHKRL